MKRRLSMLVLLALLFSGMCLVENEAVKSRPRDPTDNASAVYRLTGEFRTVFANLLWIKADCYHHEFIEHNPNWYQNKELLGMMKMITALDPRFVEAYSTGSYIIMYGSKNPPKALAYLHEGILTNPKSRELNQLAAIFYAHNLKDPVRALPYAQRAARYSEDDWTRNLTIRLLHDIRDMIKDKQVKSGRA